MVLIGLGLQISLPPSPKSKICPSLSQAKHGKSKLFWAQGEQSSDFDFVTKPIRSSQASYFWLELAQYTLQVAFHGQEITFEKKR